MWTRHDRAGKPGAPLTSHAFAHNLKQYAAEAGIRKIHVHQLRHAFGRMVADETGSLDEVQEALGHRNRATTRVYVPAGRSLFLCLLALTFMALAHSQAPADEVTITGSTSGTVGGVSQLGFSGNTFTGTALCVGALSGSNNLGTFALSTGTLQPASGTFTLNVTFMARAGITGGQGTTFTATITGSVSPNVNWGGVLVHFNSPTQTFTFSNGATSGSFTLTLADLFVQTGQTAQLTAGFKGQQSTVPEPATLILLGTELSGVAAAARRRRKGAGS